ncbi:MAG: MltA domain-containing protein [Magnetospirillum sp.]|nr:MltA domain-containing protein [Magnetospirillum sp.]
MRRLLAVSLATLAWACAPSGPPAPTVVPPPPAPSVPLPGERLSLQPMRFGDLPGWAEDAAAEVLPALLKSCDRIAKLPFDRSIGPEGTGGIAADWYAPCAAARRIAIGDHASTRMLFEEWFAPHLATMSGRAEGTFTGYYEPELDASRQPGGRFTVPLYGRPRDLITVDLGRFRPDLGSDQLAGRLAGTRLDPYPTRAQIEAGALKDLAEPLAWLADPVDAHILHIQGSGRLRFEDGSRQRFGVAATNGQRFVGIGKVLKDKGKLTGDTSMPAIRTWLKAHPGEARTLMAENPRYIFYRPVDGDGPIGSEGVSLTAQRSMAVDTRYVPLGMPLWLDTVTPAGQPLRRLVMAQDTGAAIKGGVRGDFFWGSGEAAFQQAGTMKSPGRYWLMLPRIRSPRVAAAN